MRKVLKYDTLSEAEKATYKRNIENLHYKASMVSTTKTNAENEVYKQGKVEGLVEGKTKEKFNIAKLMLSAGEAIDKISKFTGLTLAEIEQVAEDIKNG